MIDNMMLKNELLSHQKAAVEKLSKLKVGALFMEQGTGKTITALEICRARLESNKINKIIWLCPCSAKNNIKDEILKQAPKEMLEFFIICGIETLSSSIRVNSYLLLVVDQYNCFMIIDESLMVKNPAAYRTKNITRLSRKCPYRLILNGTPISKNEADLFSQFYILDWRILGYKTYWSFAANHLEYDKYNPTKLIRTLNVDYLSKKIEPYIYQVKKDECLQLPDKQYSSEWFYLTDAQARHYCDISDKLLFDLDEFNPETIYRLFSGLQSIISGKRVYFEKGEKGYEHIKTTPFFEDVCDNPRIQKLLSFIDSKEKTIIFCKYTEEITSICKILNDKYGDGSVTRFDGLIPLKKRISNLQKFKDDATFLVANRSCAGFSLNLQFCHRIINYSNDWNLATRLQSEDRVHRYGQQHEVEIIDIYAENTLDEKIIECLRNKENLLEKFKDKIAESNKEEIAEWLYGKRNGKRTKSKVNLFDCSDLEEKNA